MPTLNILTEAEVSEYVSSLDLSEGSEAWRTLNSLTLLSSETFAMVVSALAQRLVTFTDIRALPGINDRLVRRLVADRSDDSDTGALAWRYREEWVPASVNLGAARADAIGDQQTYLASKFFDFRTLIVKPRYDFTRSDETAFHTYSEAYVAYMVKLGAEDVQGLISEFLAGRAQLAESAGLPQLELCPVYAEVRRVLSDAVFLERPNWALPEMLGYLVSRSYAGVAPGNFVRFMDEFAYAEMANQAAADAARSGRPGVEAILGVIPWTPVTGSSDYQWRLDALRMARIHLPAAYGIDVAADRGRNAALVQYMDLARDVILQVRSLMALRIQVDASTLRVVAGAPRGLLLTLTNP